MTNALPLRQRLQPLLQPLFLLKVFPLLIRQQEKEHVAAFQKREGVALLVELLLQLLAHAAVGLLQPGFGLFGRVLAKQAGQSSRRSAASRSGRVKSSCWWRARW